MDEEEFLTPEQLEEISNIKICKLLCNKSFSILKNKTKNVFVTHHKFALRL